MQTSYPWQQTPPTADLIIGQDLWKQVDTAKFRSILKRYGNWVTTYKYGLCWKPADVRPGWQPYTLGHWVNTSFGPVWSSDEPWGGITCHYGRWALDARHGWVWIAGGDWSPGWVAFRQGRGFIGWAPLPPNVPAARATGAPAIPPKAYVYLPQRDFFAKDMRHDLIKGTEAYSLFERTAPGQPMVGQGG
ncbi:MAG TPA: DUF6600 domain-containing protein [Tepidisphaeraceae bacterium]|nr:DUF6600 domain-containing protein [Tepidisphaeraceae bacterium]